MTANKAGRITPVGPLAFNLLAIVIGLVSGAGAVVFRGLIAVFHNLLFLGQFSFRYDANVHTPGIAWDFLVVFAPVVAALGVAYLVKNFAPEAKGHGVPEVMEAIYYNKGLIRPIVAVIKSVASSLSIGSGGSAGREGPMIQIGAACGSAMGQWITMPPWQRVTLVAAGAGGGIAASFNTPVGGILFAVEIVMHELSVRTLVPVALGTVTATYISRLVFGAYPSFVIPQFQIPGFAITSPWALLLFVGLGIAMGLASTLFIRSLYATEDLFEKRMPGNYYFRHASAMLIVGIMFYLMMRGFGHYYVQGVGYATVQDVLTGKLSWVLLLLLLFLLKMLATSLTLGSGASGGVFSPSFFMGATLGGAYGGMLSRMFPALKIAPATFAVAGMAGLVGGVTGAAMAAIVMIFEMTLDYHVIIPVTITVALSYALRKVLCPDSIYTLKLTRRRRDVPAALQADLSRVKRVKDIMQTSITALPASSTLEAFAKSVLEHPLQTHFLVCDGDRVVGVVGRDAAVAMLDQSHAVKTLGEIAETQCTAVSTDARLADLLGEMYATGASIVLVTDNTVAPSISDIQGFVTKQEAATAMIGAVELFCDETPRGEGTASK